MEIALADTTGNASPDQVNRLFRHAIGAWGHRFAFHGHDTYGMGVANVAAAWEAGCRVFDSAAGGIGGCPFAPGATGNVATEDVVWMFGAWACRPAWTGRGCWSPPTWRPPSPARCPAGGCGRCRRRGWRHDASGRCPARRPHTM
jgi:hypothetical protein